MWDGGDCINNSAYIPILIVAKDISGNFIHTRQADVDKIYYCPCCDKKVKIRADESIHMQRHFYHFEGSECTKETLYHWVYKNWLFVDDSKFIINDNTYTVSQIYIEKTFQTKFGAYRPDIYVETKEGCSFFFEINYSSKKDRELACKWIDLDRSVVEVEIRDLLLADFNQSIPVFDLIFKDGKYLRKYQEREQKDLYSSTVMEYKGSIDNDINRFNRLDNIWIALIQYKAMKASLDNVVNVICSDDNKDLKFCMKLLKKLKCVDVYEKCKEYVNDRFIKEIESIRDLNFDKANFYIKQKSQQIYYIICNFESKLFDINVYDNIQIKFRSTDGVFYLELLEKNINKEFDKLRKAYTKFKIIENHLKNNEDRMQLIIENIIRYENFSVTENKLCLSSLRIKIVYEDFIHSKFIKESIGTDYVNFYNVANYDIDEKHIQHKKDAIAKLDLEIKREILQNNLEYKFCIEEIKKMIQDISFISIHENINDLKLCIECGRTFYYDLSNIDDLCFKTNGFLKDIKSLINYLISINNIVNEYKEKINSCKNNIWNCNVIKSYYGYKIQIGIKKNEKIVFTEEIILEIIDILSFEDNKCVLKLDAMYWEEYIKNILANYMRSFFNGKSKKIFIGGRNRNKRYLVNEYRLMEVCE